jgi:post-segregation antitoxin (ccd killing protein)
MSSKTIAIPDDRYERLQALVVAESTTVEALVTKATQRDLARRWLERTGREALARRRDMTDDAVEALVARFIQECRERAAADK